MKKRVIGWVLLWLPAVLGATPTDTGPAAPAPVILILGDSLSAGYGIAAGRGWVALLEQRLKQQGYPQRVTNASISGDTTGGGRLRLTPLLQDHRPQVVVLALGANDGLRGLALKTVGDNLNAMIGASLRAGARVLLVGQRLPPNYGPYADRFFTMYHELARQHGLAYVPFLLDGIALDASLMQRDNLHPNEAAQARLLENIWPQLQPLLPHETRRD